MAESVLFSATSGIATITLNRPAVLNALDDTLLDGLEAAFDRVAADPALRVVVLGGAGAGFMAGGDIKMFTGLTAMAPAERRVRFERFIHRVHPLILAMRRLPLPIVARVHGACAGFGMSLMMACDLALAAEDTIFTLAYTLIGTSPDGGSTWFLPRQVGASLPEQLAAEAEAFADCAAMEDFAEGVAAFVGKRPPRFG
jgi:2-(1,2-epoxy-1,2-dihydrophenyl)acetyl-CoA isomerase